MNDNDYLKRIGDSIVKYRKAKNLTQLDLASRMNIEDSSLRRIEKGKVNSSILMLQRVSTALDIKLSDILPDEFSDK